MKGCFFMLKHEEKRGMLEISAYYGEVKYKLYIENGKILHVTEKKLGKENIYFPSDNIFISMCRRVIAILYNYGNWYFLTQIYSSLEDNDFKSFVKSYIEQMIISFETGLKYLKSANV